MAVLHHLRPPDGGARLKHFKIAAILTAALMLRELGLPEAAGTLEAAVRDALSAGMTTPDLGGTAGTRSAAAWIAERVAAV